MTPAVDDLAGLLRVIGPDDSRAVVLIDGGAGSGKTSLGNRLSEQWPGPVQLVGLDELYPGWGGLAEASRAVVEHVLRPWRPGYRRWDWTESARGEWVHLDQNLPLIVEGCGALTPASRALATFGIWCEVDASTRRRRALERDGALFESHWDEWAAQEAAHWQAHRPWELADVILD